MGFEAVYVVLVVTFFAILGGLLFHKILGLYIEGALGGLECFIVGGLYVGLLISIVTLKSYIAIPLAIGLIGLLFYSLTQDRRIIRRLYTDQIRTFRETIESDPKNLAARGRLAQALYKTGCLDEAIAEMSQVVQQSPESKHEEFLLREYVAEQAARKSPSVVCPSCGFRNSPGRTHCYNCERSLARKTGLKKWLAEGRLKQFAVTLGIAIACITILILALTRR